MARLDPLIDLMLKEPGAFLIMETGMAASLHTASGARPVIRQQLTTVQIVGACAEVLPPELKEGFPGQSPSEFRYAAPVGPVRVRFEPLGDRVKATLRPDVLVPAPPPMVELGTAKKQLRSGPPVSSPGGALQTLLDLMLSHSASDLHLQSDEVPLFRIDGDMVPLEGHGKITPARLAEMLWAITPEKNQEQWTQVHDTDFAHETSAARFRVNLFSDRKGIGAVLRQIPNIIKSADELKVPRAVVDLCDLSKGLVLVTGPTGSGKSTTLAALIDTINRTRDDHIITIEDPIEFVHPNKRCLVNQREIGVHTHGFKAALRAALREDPDVVLVGEMRDLETISIALETAETGHLVFGTLHTNTAPSTIDRVIDQFPADRQEQVRAMLAESLKGVITQVLCKRIGGGRVAAQEVLLVNPAIANLIREGKTFQVQSVMQTSRNAGMVTMNDALLELVKSGQVAPKDALAKSQAKVELKAAIERAGISLDPAAPVA